VRHEGSRVNTANSGGIVIYNPPIAGLATSRPIGH